MLLMIDNYDSFTYNLVQYLGELGADVVVHRNDQITIAQIEELTPEKIVISPGPCTPNEAGDIDRHDQDICRSRADSGCLSRSPEYRPGIWRQDRPCAGHHAWQDVHDSPQ